MSIVGTRPPLISETNLYEPRHKARLAIKPGITGMWQVSGRSDITDFEEVVRLDKEYMRNYRNHEQGYRLILGSLSATLLMCCIQYQDFLHIHVPRGLCDPDSTGLHQV